MPLTITAVDGAKSVSGTIREEFFDITFDDSYPTGGEALDAGDFGFISIYGIAPAGGNAVAIGGNVHFDTANTKLMVQFAPDPGGAGGAAEAFAEAPDTTDLSTYTFRCRVTGI